MDIRRYGAGPRVLPQRLQRHDHDRIGARRIGEHHCGLQTGELEYLRVDPNGHDTGGFQETDDGYVPVPADAVSAKNDYLLVEPENP